MRKAELLPRACSTELDAMLAAATKSRKRHQMLHSLEKSDVFIRLLQEEAHLKRRLADAHKLEQRVAAKEAVVRAVASKRKVTRSLFNSHKKAKVQVPVTVQSAQQMPAATVTPTPTPAASPGAVPSAISGGSRAFSGNLADYFTSMSS